MGSPVATLQSRPSRSSKRFRTVREPGITEVSDMAVSSQNWSKDLIKTFSRERLHDEKCGSGGLRLLLHLRRALGRDEAELDLVAGRAQFAQNVDAGHLRHVPVGDDQVGALRRRLVQCLLAVRGLDQVVIAESGLPQRAGDDLTHDPAVVRDQDLHSVCPLTSARLCKIEMDTGSPSHIPYRPATRSALGYREAVSGASTTWGSDSAEPAGSIALTLPPTMLASSPSTSDRSSWLTSSSPVARKAAVALRAAAVEDA